MQGLIASGRLKGDQLKAAYTELASVNAQLADAKRTAGDAVKDAATKAKEAAKAQADAAKEAKQKFQAALDTARGQIGGLFQGPVIAPTD